MAKELDAPQCLQRIRYPNLRMAGGSKWLTVKDSNLQPAVLETAAPPVELTAKFLKELPRCLSGE